VARPRTYPEPVPGQQFGRLTLVECVIEGGRRSWVCNCVCGRKRVVREHHLIAGRSKACPACASSLLEPGASGLNQLIAAYKSNARNRGLLWELSREEARSITSQDCFYCGAPPAQIVQKRSKMGGHDLHGRYVYNGIDRIDNALGYFLANVQPCCKLCNQAKSDLPLDEFLALVNRIALRHPA
jgi:hypothetical protein